METLTWHQQNAVRRAWRLRRRSAHIEAPDYLRTGKMLCGVTRALVVVDAAHRNNPQNKCCARCKRIADKLNLSL